MKKVIILAFVLLLTISFVYAKEYSENVSHIAEQVAPGTFGDYHVSGSYIFQDNVGIGTDAPEGMLHVAEGDNTYGAASKPSIILGQDTLDRTGTIKLYGTVDGTYGLIQATTNNLHIDPIGGGGLYLNWFDGDRIYLGSGSVFDNYYNRLGIGTASPTQALDVVGTVKATSFIGDGSQLTGVSGPWVQGTGQVTYSDNVGIGTATPTAALHVTGAGQDTSPNTVGIQIGSDGNNAAIEITTAGGTPYIDFQNDIAGTDYDMRLRLTGDDSLAIEGGKVGIGTTVPDRMLDVEGDVEFKTSQTYSSFWYGDTTGRLLVKPDGIDKRDFGYLGYKINAMKVFNDKLFFGHLEGNIKSVDHYGNIDYLGDWGDTISDLEEFSDRLWISRWDGKVQGCWKPVSESNCYQAFDSGYAISDLQEYNGMLYAGDTGGILYKCSPDTGCTSLGDMGYPIRKMAVMDGKLWLDQGGPDEGQQLQVKRCDDADCSTYTIFNLDGYYAYSMGTFGDRVYVGSYLGNIKSVGADGSVEYHGDWGETINDIMEYDGRLLLARSNGYVESCSYPPSSTNCWAVAAESGVGIHRLAQFNYTKHARIAMSPGEVNIEGTLTVNELNTNSLNLNTIRTTAIRGDANGNVIIWLG